MDIEGKHKWSGRISLALYLGLLTPALVVCKGERPGKTDHVQWHTRTCGGVAFLLYSCKAAFWSQETIPRLSDVELSVILWSMFVIGSALTYSQFFQECATPPHVQACHCTWLSFTRTSPMLVLQARNAGARRPGYQA